MFISNYQLFVLLNTFQFTAGAHFVCNMKLCRRRPWPLSSIWFANIILLMIKDLKYFIVFKDKGSFVRYN